MSDVSQGQEPGPAVEAAGGGLESVTCHEQLVTQLARQFARADVSLRELQTRADRAGGTRLPRTTCADMLAGRRFPKKAVMVAFLRACDVPDQLLPAWERAWERVRVDQMPAGFKESPVAEPPDGAPPYTQDAGAPGDAGTARRHLRIALVAAVVVPAVAAALGAVIARQATPHQAAPETAPAPVVDSARIVTDDGRAFPRGGSSRFTVSVDPANTGVRLIRRLDAGVGLQHATITVNGTPAAQWRPLLEDGVFKWRNQIVALPPKLTAGRHSLTIVNTNVSSTGFNEFRYTVQHRLKGVWSLADTVDVGRGHTASEAAHGYRVVGQDWADTQTFAYPPRRETWDVQ